MTAMMVKPSHFEIHSDVQDDAGRLSLVGELDLATVPQLEDHVRALLARAVRDLVIDLSRLSFIDSSGLHLLILLNQRASAEEWTLRLIRPSRQALAVFQITGAEAHLPFVEDHGSP